MQFFELLDAENGRILFYLSFKKTIFVRSLELALELPTPSPSLQ